VGDWNAYPPELNSRRLYNGPGPGPMLQTAASLRALREALEELAASVESLLRQLLSTWSGATSDRADPAFQRYTAGLREMAAVTDVLSQQAAAQAQANASARSSMPKEAAVMAIKAAYAAALASQNYGLAAALMAVYMGMWFTAANTMSGYQGATLPNMNLTPPQQAPAITSPTASASDSIGRLMDSFNSQPGQSFCPPEPMDPPQSTSSTLAELNGGGLGGGGLDGLAGALGGGIGMALGGVAALASMATGFHMPPGWQSQPAPKAFGLAGGTPGPMAGGVPPAMMGGSGARARRDREKERERTPLDGAVVAPDREDEVPELPGVLEASDTDDVAVPSQATA
jgi:uncharacterized protein YukE